MNRRTTGLGADAPGVDIGVRESPPAEIRIVPMPTDEDLADEIEAGTTESTIAVAITPAAPARRRGASRAPRPLVPVIPKDAEVGPDGAEPPAEPADAVPVTELPALEPVVAEFESAAPPAIELAEAESVAAAAAQAAAVEPIAERAPEPAVRGALWGPEAAASARPFAAAPAPPAEAAAVEPIAERAPAPAVRGALWGPEAAAPQPPVEQVVVAAAALPVEPVAAPVLPAEPGVESVAGQPADPGVESIAAFDDPFATGALWGLDAAVAPQGPAVVVSPAVVAPAVPVAPRAPAAPAMPGLARRIALGLAAGLGVILGAAGGAILRFLARLANRFLDLLASPRLLRTQVVLLLVGSFTVGGAAALTQLGPINVHGEVVVQDAAAGGDAGAGACTGATPQGATLSGAIIEVWDGAGGGAIAQAVIGAGKRSGTQCRLPFVVEGVRRGLDGYRLVLHDAAGNPLGVEVDVTEADLLHSVSLEIGTPD